MAGFFQSFGIADLALGKPGLYWLPVTARVEDALRMLKELNLTEISIWDCSSEQPKQYKVSEARNGIRKRDCRDCQCVGRVSILDIVCYFARDDKVQSLDAASQDPVSVLLPATKRHIRHLDFHSSFLVQIGRRHSWHRLTEAFNLILDGAQYLVVPLDSRRSRSLKHCSPGVRKSNGIDKYTLMEFCWLTHEDVLRFMLGCIAVFSPLPMMSIEDLGIIDREVMYVDVNAKALDAVPLILRASQHMTAVAVVEGEQQGEHCGNLKLVGDMSLSSLRFCDETAALALATLSVSDFLTYTQDAGGASKALKELILSELRKKASVLNIEQVKTVIGLASDDSNTDSSENGENEMWEESSTDESSSTASSEALFDALSLSDQCEFRCKLSTPRNTGSPLTCHPWSSLVAVMAQALAYRTTYLWVTDNDNTLIGIVAYVDIIRVLLNHLLSFE